ncbi:MAG TPA: tRNA lysidine(34) synthetase TilS [Candidatus Binatia bacterium]|nr:tRNA lysidine(34) synthetase TilS [Candidatus Binatia bacterium]
MSRAASNRLPRRSFAVLAKVRSALEEAGVRDCRILAGVSGGGDSMALLLMLAELASSLHLEVEVLCVDHGLRAEAATEQQLVAEACSRTGFPFHLARVTPEDDSEDACRRHRHAALAQAATEHGCRWIVLAHTADDQIETIVLRFLRGAGLGGLAAMDPVSDRVVRPLLDVRRCELRSFLIERRQMWADDATNLSDRYARGRLRTGVLPAIERSFGEGVLTHLLESSRHWRRDHWFLEIEAARLEAYCVRRGRNGNAEIELASVMDAHIALRARVVRRWLTGLGMSGAPDASYVEQVLAMIEAGSGASGIDLPGVRVWCENGRLVGARAGDETSPMGTIGGRSGVLPPAKGRVRLRRVTKKS